MIPLLQVLGVSRGRIDFLTSAVDPTDGTTITFSGVSLGTASADRTIIVAVSSGSASSGYVTGVTIRGVAATLDQVAGASVGGTAIARAVVPTGATGDVVITYSATVARTVIGVYRAPAVTVAATATITGGALTAALATATITNPTGGTVVACAYTHTLTPSWTGAVADHATQTETVWGSSARSTVAGALTITAAASGSAQDNIAAVAYALV